MKTNQQKDRLTISLSQAALTQLNEYSKATNLTKSYIIEYCISTIDSNDLQEMIVERYLELNEAKEKALIEINGIFSDAH